MPETDFKEEIRERVEEAIEQDDDLEEEEEVVDLATTSWAENWCPSVTFQGDKRSFCDLLEEAQEVAENEEMDLSEVLEEALDEPEESSSGEQEQQAEQETLSANE